MLEGMRHAKRFDLSPDIFLRVTEVSLSRTGFHSPEKLASRITVLRETGQRMIDKGLVERYQKGLRSMYLDIFFNAAGSRQSPAIRAMRTLDRTCDLFNEKERKWMQALVLLYRLRAYRVPGFAQWLNQRVRSIEARPDVTLNRIAYQPAKDYQQNTAS
jgi:hypothetical protein